MDTAYCSTPRSGPAPQLAFEHVSRPAQRNRRASIVIIGNRGVGTSSLSLILSIALGYRLINLDESFRDQHNAVHSDDHMSNGSVERTKEVIHHLKSLLEDHPRDCVIACGPACLIGDGPNLLHEYASSHVVLHVVRDRSCIQDYLRPRSDTSFQAFSRHVDKLLRSCSNYEYYNLSQRNPGTEMDAMREERNMQGQAPSLRLKHVARDFLKFVYRIIDQPSREHGSSLDLAPEERHFTYSLAIQLPLLHRPKVEIHTLKPGADVIELVVSLPSDEHWLLTTPELDAISEAVAIVRRHSDAPLVYHVLLPSSPADHQSDGPTAKIQMYHQLLEFGFRLACEYVTVDLRLTDEKISYFELVKAGSKIIGHYHDHDPEPSAWLSLARFGIYERAKTLRCDLVRLVQPATCRESNIEVQEFTRRVQQQPKPRPVLIAYNTGALGRTSCIFNKTFTPLTLQGDQPSATAPLTLQKAQQGLFAAFVLDPLNFYVLGSDISYSVSPGMFRRAFEACGIPHTFDLVKSSSLVELGQRMKENQYGGSTCARPFKTDILPFVDVLSPSAAMIGAVNTLVPLRKFPTAGTLNYLEACHEPNCAGSTKAIFGDNTDWIGIESCIHRSLSPANAVKADTTALVIGSGALARAAIFALMKLGVPNVFILNRTMQKAQDMARDIVALNERGQRPSTRSHQRTESAPSLHVIDSKEQEWPSKHARPTLIIVCVPEYSAISIPESWTKNRTGGVFVHMAYKTLDDPMVQHFRAKAGEGWIVQDGLDVHPEQAFAQFELFTGRPAPRQLMRETALRDYRDEQGRKLDEGEIQRRLQFV
ncbi:type I 3-dehydroquinase-domain-containing protein [Delphinella strobiligena]|nr:type I 3-dehydroquinase-domain-containing protein [Delphinella strobiligena]